MEIALIKATDTEVVLIKAQVTSKFVAWKEIVTINQPSGTSPVPRFRHSLSELIFTTFTRLWAAVCCRVPCNWLSLVPLPFV